MFFCPSWVFFDHMTTPLPVKVCPIFSTFRSLISSHDYLACYTYCINLKVILEDRTYYHAFTTEAVKTCFNKLDRWWSGFNFHTLYQLNHRDLDFQVSKIKMFLSLFLSDNRFNSIVLGLNVHSNRYNWLLTILLTRYCVNFYRMLVRKKISLYCDKENIVNVLETSSVNIW